MHGIAPVRLDALRGHHLVSFGDRRPQLWIVLRERLHGRLYGTLVAPWW